jgi:hypothetical protein
VYSQLEDRISFGFNTTQEELYEFFLTRAITKSLTDQGDKIAEQFHGALHNERSSKLISEFQKDGLKKQINFEDYFEGGRIRPLGEAPILVSQVQFELQNDVVRISITLVTTQIVSFSLAIVQLQALILLLEKLAIQAYWNIIPGDVSSIISQEVFIADPDHLH